MLKSRKFYLRRAKMLAFLHALNKDDSLARTLYIPAGSSPQQVAHLIEKVDTADVAPEIPELAAGSRTGAVMFWGESGKYLVLPPFPVTQERLEHGVIIEPLSSALGKDLKIAIVLVRLGACAIGLCRGESLVASYVGTGNIHARHRQGGSSAKRFERHREKQTESFLARVCGHLTDILKTEAETVDYIVYGGAETTILLLRKRCHFLEQFDDRRLLSLLDIAEPRRDVLEASAGRIWASQVIEWYDPTVSPGASRLMKNGFKSFPLPFAKLVLSEANGSLP